MLPGRPFLCLRRGVSGARRMYLIMFPFSLPTQRCFCHPSNHYCLYWAFLCLRRGVSAGSGSGLRLPRFSLPTQRCFWKTLYPLQSQHLFSAYAEVFPDTLQSGFSALTFLCLRRGVSRVQTDLWNLLYFSLPTQRCFCRRIQCRHCRGLFSAYAEVFLSTVSRRRKSLPFLCLRRGVSSGHQEASSGSAFSLPTQRCF